MPPNSVPEEVVLRVRELLPRLRRDAELPEREAEREVLEAAEEVLDRDDHAQCFRVVVKAGVKTSHPRIKDDGTNG